MILGIHELDTTFISIPGLAQQAVLKKTKVELELSADTDVLLMIEKVI